MTIQHHPSDELLLDYASGSLNEVWSLGIATHLALCPTCRQTLARLECIGGALIETLPTSQVSDSLFDRVMGRIDMVGGNTSDGLETSSVETWHADPEQCHTDITLPNPVRKYVGGDIDILEWEKLGFGAHQLRIPIDETQATARLLRIPAGRPVPEHSHNGAELTLVLRGAFFDSTGTYRRGDLQEADENLEHQPRAEASEDCICLVITDAPLRFKSVAARLVQPLLGI
ncbi:MAG: hypothetical protein CBB68_11900 [Rhodospirillaceae bacterium TMED8]|nr:transcriptional regulator [Magnetovibrio sp.]OUT49271.1 MAG: hypothetical protein CBB68_11900 [Rhodospirillaceae bacterium TMED8]|tara:strand:- start:199 stop:888 length:690 start_codon:yes stop_codon:yes gene_type:complete